MFTWKTHLPLAVYVALLDVYAAWMVTRIIAAGWPTGLVSAVILAGVLALAVPTIRSHHWMMEPYVQAQRIRARMKLREQLGPHTRESYTVFVSDRGGDKHGLHE